MVKKKTDTQIVNGFIRGPNLNEWYKLSNLNMIAVREVSHTQKAGEGYVICGETKSSSWVMLSDVIGDKALAQKTLKNMMENLYEY